MANNLRGPRDLTFKARNKILRWVLIIGMGVLAYGLGLYRGYRHYEQDQNNLFAPPEPLVVPSTSVKPSVHVDSLNNTQNQKSPTKRH